MGTMRVLHIHAQEDHHNDAFIVGTRAGLLALREAIDLALTVRTGASEVSVGDGEGYCVLAMLIDADEHGFPADNASVPYTADYAMENQDNAVYPWTRIGPKEYDALIRDAAKRRLSASDMPTAAEIAERDTYNQLSQDIPPDVRKKMADTIDNMYEPDGDGGGVANG